MILSKQEIIRRIKSDKLITNVNTVGVKTGDTEEIIEYDIQPASYDLRVGTIIKKIKQKAPWDNQIQETRYDTKKAVQEQSSVTLEPGQILFIITHEDINMPKDLCGTVYSKNNLALQGILAWTTGHVDPGFKGPIIIRLINLRSINYTIRPGEKVYTIVFDELKHQEGDLLEARPTLSRDKAIKKVTESANAALSNALFDLALLNNFVKKEEFGRILFKWFFGTLKSSIVTIISLILFLMGVAVSLNKFISLLKDWGILDK